MKDPIYKAIVIVHNQEECDVARDICFKYSLPVWKDLDRGFSYMVDDDDATYLQYQDKYSSRDDDHIGFYVDYIADDNFDNYNRVSIEEFEALASNLNPIYNSIEDILSKMKELNNILNNK